MKRFRLLLTNVVRLVVACCLISSGTSYAQTLTSSNLPLILIDSQGQTINDEPGIICNLKIINNETGINTPTDTPNDYDGKAKIEYRGCSSQNFPKKPLGIELRSTTAVTTSINAPILGFPSESDWILNASYSDKTFARDPLSYYMSNVAGRYASRTKPVEVIINGVYAGIFILQEKIKRDANRININKLEPADLGNNSITGGYIVKIDKTCGDFDPAHQWQSAYQSPGGNRAHYWLTDYPNDDNLVPQQFTYIQNYVNGFETMMASATCCQAVNGYANYLVDDTFVDYLLMQEATSNADAYRFSSYFSKERNSKGGKLSAGPVWDFSLAMGFLTAPFTGYTQSYQGWRYTASGDPAFPVPFWWGKLLTCCAYNHKVVARYQQLRQTVWQTATLTAFIDAHYALLNQGAYTRNFQKWPIIGVSTWNDQPSYNGATLLDEVNYLKTWLTNRLNWLDTNIGSFIQEPLAIISPGSLSIDAGQTAPLSMSFTGDAPWSYTLSSGLSGTATSSPTMLSLSPSQTTTYTVQSVSNSCGTGLQSGSVVVTVTPVLADLSLNMVANRRVLAVGDVVDLVLNLHNNGPQTALSVQAQNRLPDGLSFIGSSSTAVTATNGIVSMTVPELPTGQTISYTYQVQINTNGQFWNAAQVAASISTDPDSQPNSGTGDGQDDMTVLDLRVGDDLSIVHVSPNPNQTPLPLVQPNQPPTDPAKVELNLAMKTNTLTPKVSDVITLTLTVGNRGGLVANNVVIQTLLPMGWSVTNASGLTVTGQTITANLGSVSAGGLATVVIPIQATTDGTLKAQILSVTEPNAGAIIGNGYTNGEKDEASLSIRAK